MSTFFEKINQRQQEIASLLCVGLDPDPERIPAEFLSQNLPIFAFNKMIIDSTKDYACCYKPQFAHFAAAGAEAELVRTIDYIQALGIPVILDAKRGDVGSTADFYAREAFDRYNADAVTVNPYMGSDSLKPFLERADKGIIFGSKFDTKLIIWKDIAKYDVDKNNNEIIITCKSNQPIKTIKLKVGKQLKNSILILEQAVSK